MTPSSSDTAFRLRRCPRLVAAHPIRVGPPAPQTAKVTFCVRGVLSPLLSNVVLDELDKELERRGHQFVRYADDCNIYTASERAGHRVMASISAFITRHLKLKVNVE